MTRTTSLLLSVGGPLPLKTTLGFIKNAVLSSNKLSLSGGYISIPWNLPINAFCPSSSLGSVGSWCGSTTTSTCGCNAPNLKSNSKVSLERTTPPPTPSNATTS